MGNYESFLAVRQGIDIKPSLPQEKIETKQDETISGEVENLKANETSGVNSDHNLDGSQENQESDSDKKVEGAQENQNLGDDEASTDSQALKDGDKEKKGGAANKTKAGAAGKNKS